MDSHRNMGNEFKLLVLLLLYTSFLYMFISINIWAQTTPQRNATIKWECVCLFFLSLIVAVCLFSSESNSFQENHSFLFNVSDRFALLFFNMWMCLCVFFLAFWAHVSVRPFSIEKIFSDRYAYLFEIGLGKCWML